MLASIFLEEIGVGAQAALRKNEMARKKKKRWDKIKTVLDTKIQHLYENEIDEIRIVKTNILFWFRFDG